MLPLLARVDLEAIAIKGYWTISKAPALLESHHQIFKCYISDTCWEGVLLLCRGAASVFYSSSWLGNLSMCISLNIKWASTLLPVPNINSCAGYKQKFLKLTWIIVLSSLPDPIDQLLGWKKEKGWMGKLSTLWIPLTRKNRYARRNLPDGDET